MAFEKLSSIIEVKTEYTTRSALAIMSGREEAFAPLDQVVTTVGGQPVIPGSSLKGALRSAVESLLAERKIPVCVPDSAIPKEHSRDREGYARRIGRLPACEGRGGGRRPCPVCQVFGAADLAARASFLDAKPVGTPKLIERSHVALTRDNKAAAGGKLLQLQAVDAGTKFTGTIRIINAENWHVGSVLAGLKTLELTAIGGKKSAGYGDLEVRIDSITQLMWTETAWQPREALSPEIYLKAFADLRV
jgi:CRISPR-associated RAMP protein (TIGR02581 family)